MMWEKGGIMTAKEYLMQIHRLDEDIKSNRRRIEELKYSIGGIRAIDYAGDKVSGSNDPDPMASQIAQLVDLERKVNAETVDLQKAKDKIINEIRHIEDTRYVTLLTRRYVDCERWEQIAVDMNESIRHVFRIHGDALKAFKDRIAI